MIVSDEKLDEVVDVVDDVVDVGEVVSPPVAMVGVGPGVALGVGPVVGLGVAFGVGLMDAGALPTLLGPWISSISMRSLSGRRNLVKRDCGSRVPAWKDRWHTRASPTPAVPPAPSAAQPRDRKGVYDANPPVRFVPIVRSGCRVAGTHRAYRT